MKELKKVKDFYNTENDKLYTIENGLHVRDIIIDAGVKEEVYIGQVADLHYNYCNQQDFDEANPVVMSSYENRTWQANAASVPVARKCLEFISDSDQMIVNGDTLDYLTYGAMELMQKEIWDKYPNVLATLGGHELTRKMQGKVPDETTLESRLELLQDFWQHNIYYESRVIKDSVMVVCLLNDHGRYNSYQAEKLKADLALAREKNYPVLVFQHEPINTYNPRHNPYSKDDVIMIGFEGGISTNYCDDAKRAGSKDRSEEELEVYNLIVNSADIVKAVFAGHLHNHMCLDIFGKTPDGKDAVIPQYIHYSSVYDEGHIMRIIVK